MGLTGTVIRRTLTIRLKTGVEDTWDKDDFSRWEFVPSGYLTIYKGDTIVGIYDSTVITSITVKYPSS